MAGVLKPLKALGPMLVHVKAAVKAVAGWWTSMSDADKRQARQRALTVGACAAVFAFGGPLVAQRFGDQKARETYLNEAAQLAETIAADHGQVSTTEVRPGLFSAKADISLLQQVSPTQASPTQASMTQASMSQASLGDFQPVADIISGFTLRARDSAALEGLVTFTLDDLGPFKGVDKQLDCLSRAVYYEARSEDTVGQMAVAEVVMNRVRDPRFPKTICDVVFQGQYRDTGCQFTFTCDGSVRQKPVGGAWDRAKDVALHVMLGLNKPVTNKATHYHTDYVNPYWAPSLVETAEIGTHIFYRFPRTTKEWSSARVALAASRAQDQALDPADVGSDVQGMDAMLEDVPADALQSLITVSIDKDDVPVVATKAVAAKATDGVPL